MDDKMQAQWEADYDALKEHYYERKAAAEASEKALEEQLENEKKRRQESQEELENVKKNQRELQVHYIKYQERVQARIEELKEQLENEKKRRQESQEQLENEKKRRQESQEELENVKKRQRREVQVRYLKYQKLAQARVKALKDERDRHAARCKNTLKRFRVYKCWARQQRTLKANQDSAEKAKAEEASEQEGADAQNAETEKKAEEASEQEGADAQAKEASKQEGADAQDWRWGKLRFPNKKTSDPKLKATYDENRKKHRVLTKQLANRLKQTPTEPEKNRLCKYRTQAEQAARKAEAGTARG